MGDGGLSRLSGDTKWRLSQVRDTELFICTVKNSVVILHVYNGRHHAGCLLLGTSYNIASHRMSTVHCPESGITLFPPSQTRVIKSRSSGTQPHRCSSINTTTLFIYPDEGHCHCMLSAILPPNAKSLENKQGANKNKASRRAPSLLYAKALTEKLNTDYRGHMISYCLSLSFMSSSYCAVLLPPIFLNVS